MDRARYVIHGDKVVVCLPARETGIFVRAQDHTGRWRSVDISTLDRESLREWLRSRGGDNRLAENTVVALLGHPLPERN